MDYEEKIEPMTMDKFQCYLETLELYEFDLQEISAMVFEQQQMSIWEGSCCYGAEGGRSAEKEIRSLTESGCFGEVKYELLSDEDKNANLMFMAIKQSGSLKTRGVENGSVQRIYTDKNECLSPTSDFYSFKYVVTIIVAKEERDCATVDLPSFFLQTDQEKEIDTVKTLGRYSTTLDWYRQYMAGTSVIWEWKEGHLCNLKKMQFTARWMWLSWLTRNWQNSGETMGWSWIPMIYAYGIKW